MLASPLVTASWSETEVLALRAALSVIDTWDGDLGGLLEIDGSDSSHSDGSKKNVKQQCKPRRRVLKHEIMALRAEAQQLQYVVALGRALVGGGASKSHTEHVAVLQNQWERLANVQQQRRFSAELQNAKLKKLLQSQMNYAKRVMKLTRQVEMLKQALYMPPFPSFVNYKGPNIDPVTQLRSLDALIPRASLIFSSGHFPRGGLRCFNHTKFLSSTPPEDGAEMEIQSVWMVPADVARAAGAMWMQMLRPSKSDKNSMDIYQDTNAWVSQSMATSNVDDVFGALQGQVAARMLHPDIGDGSMLVVASMEAVSVVGSELRGCATFTGWIRIEKVASPDEARTGPISLIKRHFRMLMKPPAGSTLTKSERCKWTQAVIASPLPCKFDKEFESAMAATESTLLTSPGSVASPDVSRDESEAK